MPAYDVPEDLVPQRIDGLESFSMLPVGTIFVSAVPQTDARVHLLDGSTILQTGIYKTFANLIKSLVAAGHNITYQSDTEFYSDVSTYGQCGKFVIDDENGTIRLPLITEFIASNNGGKEIGLAQLDEFKSHSHTQQTSTKNDGSNQYSVEPPQQLSGWWTTHSGGSTLATGGEETRPKNVRYPYYIVLASGYKSDQVVDMDNIVTDINNIVTKLNGKQAKLTAGNGINIANDVISAGQTYVSGEQFTGNYWIDGKPIYRKCNIITIPSTTNKWNYIWTLSSRNLILLKLHSNIYHSSYEQYPNKAELYANGKELFEQHSSDYFNGKPLYIIVEYVYAD